MSVDLTAPSFRLDGKVASSPERRTARRAVRRSPRGCRRRCRRHGSLEGQARGDREAGRGPGASVPGPLPAMSRLRRLRARGRRDDGVVRSDRRARQQRRLVRRSARAHGALRARDVREDGEHRPHRALLHDPRRRARHAAWGRREHHQPVVDLRQRRLREPDGRVLRCEGWGEPTHPPAGVRVG
jgi:hypothetical protein